MVKKQAVLFFLMAILLFRMTPAFAELLGLQGDVRYYRSNGKLGLADEFGHEITSSLWAEAYPFEFGLAVVSMGDRYGVIDKTGREVIPCQWDHVVVCEKAIIVGNENGEQLLNHGGAPISPVYPMIYENQGTFVISDFANYGLLDAEGNELLSMRWSSIGEVTDHWAVVADDNYKCNIINIYTGEFLLTEWADNCTGFSNGWAACLINDDVFFIDAYRNTISTEYTYFDWFPRSGVFAVRDNREHWFLYIPEQKHAAYIRADQVLPPSEGLAPICIDGKWGYCDIDGQVIIPCAYDAVGSFVNGRAYVQTGELYFYIDQKGERVGSQGYLFANPFSEGYAACVDVQTELEGFIDPNGNWYIEPQYRFTGSTWFNNGTCILSTINHETVILNLHREILSYFTMN